MKINFKKFKKRERKKEEEKPAIEKAPGMSIL